MGERVERVRTEVSESAVAQAIAEAWQDLFHTAPSKEQLSLILAQNALETGHRKSMWNFNIGNITTDGQGPYNYFDDLKTNEQTSPGVWKKMNLKYRAYPSLKEGAKDYLQFLKSKRYSNAWEHIVNPDPVAFSKALKQSGYYTANEKDYTKSLSGLYNHFSKTPIPVTSVPSQEIPTETEVVNLDSILQKYLQEIQACEKSNRKLYKQFLPTHHIIIGVKSKDYTDAIEFSRILCAALDEELMAQAFTHTDNNKVEVQCAIVGPAKECLETVQQLTNSLSVAFKEATAKLGGIAISNKFIINKESSYQAITLQAAQTQYRKFLLKFV